MSAVGSGPFASEELPAGGPEEGVDEPKNDANALVAAEADGATAGDVESRGEDDACVGFKLKVELGGVTVNGLDLDAGMPKPVKPLNFGAEVLCIAHQRRHVREKS